VVRSPLSQHVGNRPKVAYVGSAAPAAALMGFASGLLTGHRSPTGLLWSGALSRAAHHVEREEEDEQD